MNIHEELLEAVKDIPTTRVVVELHEPTPYGHDTWQACMDCSCQDCNTFVVYPCPTIQKIQEQLK